jgi:ABC-type transporter Mla subunit MlaD
VRTMADNLYQDLRDALADLAAFLQDKADTIEPAIQTLASLVPQVNDLIDKPIALLESLKTEINRLSGNIPDGVEDAFAFAARIKDMVATARALLPFDSEAVDDVADIADLISGLPTLDQLKTEILALIDTVKRLLTEMKSVPA